VTNRSRKEIELAESDGQYNVREAPAKGTALWNQEVQSNIIYVVEANPDDDGEGLT